MYDRTCSFAGVRWSAVLFFFLLSLAPSAAAQSLTGRVQSDDGEDLPGVNVAIHALSRGAVTDNDGRYLLDNLPARSHEVVFSFIGFETQRRMVEIGASQIRLDITLIPETLEVDEVIVTGETQAVLNASTLSVATLEAKELDAVRGQTLGAMLETLPGVTTLSTGPSIAKPVVRGLHSQRVLVLNGGVPQEGQQWGGEHAPEIDPFAPARVEVIKGAAGVEYGVGAIGGVIRIEQRDLPTTARLGGRINLNGFSNNMQAAGSVLVEGGAKALPGLGWRVQSSYRRAGDARSPNHVVGNSGFEELDGSAALGYHTERFGIDGYFSHFGTELGLFRGAHIGNADDLARAIERGEPAVDYEFSFDIDAPKQTIAHDLATLKAHYQLASGDNLEAQYGFQRNRRQEFDAHRRFGDPLDEAAFGLTLTTQTLDLKFRQQPRGNFFGVFGVSAMNQANRNTETGNLIPNFRALTGGVFARETWIKGDWTVEGGGRFDYRSLEAFPRENLSTGDFVQRRHTYTNFSGVAGVIWQFASAWSIASNLGTAWRPAGVNELYNFGVHHGTAQFEIGNPDLGSERSINIDATLRHISDRASLEVSVYNNRMQGYLYLLPTLEPTVTIRGTFPTFRYTQNDAVLRGFDGAFGYRLTRWLRLGTQASVVRGTNLDADEPLIFMPADRLTLSSTFSLPRFGVLEASELEVQGQFVREQTRVPEGQDYAPPPDGYTLFGIGYNTEVRMGTVPIRIDLSVENLFDTTYRDYLSRFRYFIDDPGRNVVLRVQVPFGSVNE